MKKHLKSQTTLEEKKNGNLLVGFRVTQEKEMEELIMKWIPHLTVIEPATLREDIKKSIKIYLEKISLF